MNEPVAWMDKETGQVSRVACYDIPLYTHPVKKLTDEEIQEIAHGFGAIGWMGDTTYEFARAILRKAQGEG